MSQNQNQGNPEDKAGSNQDQNNRNTNSGQNRESGMRNQNMEQGSSAKQEDISDQSGQSSRASNVAGTNDLSNEETRTTGSKGAKYGTDSDEDKTNRNTDIGSMVNTRAGASGVEGGEFDQKQHRSETDEYKNKNQQPSDKEQSSDQNKKNNL